MTKRLFVRIIEVLILIVIVGGLLTAFIDYNRMKSNKYPIFCINYYNSNNCYLTFICYLECKNTL